MAGCTCPPTGLADEDCPVHGLREGVKFPPMDRHARQGEDARTAQRRLYLEAASTRTRLRAAGFPVPLRVPPPRFGQR